MEMFNASNTWTVYIPFPLIKYTSLLKTETMHLFYISNRLLNAGKQ